MSVKARSLLIGAVVLTGYLWAVGPYLLPSLNDLILVLRHS